MKSATNINPRLIHLGDFSLITFHFSIILLFTVPTIAQNLDSLYSVWQDSTQTDSRRVAAYSNYIQIGFMYTKPDSAAVLAEALHSYAQKHNYQKAASSAFNMKGSANHVQGNYSQALENYEKSLAIMEQIGDKQGIAITLSNIGTIYFTLSNYPRSLEYDKKSLAIHKELGNKLGIATSLNNIGTIYFDQENYIRALEYNEKSLAIHKELGDKQGIATSLNNIGNIFNRKGNYVDALEYYEKSLEIYEELGNKLGIASNLNNIGVIYTHQDKNAQAIDYHEKSLANYEVLGDKRGIALGLNNIGKNYQKQGNTTLALNYCQKGLALAEEIGALEQQKDAFNCLYNTYKAMGMSNEALVYLEKMNLIKDSLQAEETGNKLQQMEFAKQMLQDSIFKAEEARLVMEAHQSEVHRKNQARNSAYVGGFISLLLAGGFYSRWRYVRKSRDIISKEKDRADHLLLNILPAEIAAELKEKGRADARDFDMVSILFTDFKEFTRASEKLSAHELVAEINTCFEAFDAICDKYQIEKIKTIGDAYMAAGGLPVLTNDSVKNTVFAALEMQTFITQRKAKNKAEGNPAFEMRVGIHTGPVVAGIVGVKKFQYDIWGDTVNTASRMESNGEVGKVNISQATYELLKNEPDFEFEYRGQIEAKGKGMVDMYFVSKR